jgi:hypothetical protein
VDWRLFRSSGDKGMTNFNRIVEHDPDTSFFGSSVPGRPSARGQEASFEELEKKLREVIETLLEDGNPKLKSECAGLQTIQVAWPKGCLRVLKPRAWTRPIASSSLFLHLTPSSRGA